MVAESSSEVSRGSHRFEWIQQARAHHSCREASSRQLQARQRSLSAQTQGSCHCPCVIVFAWPTDVYGHCRHLRWDNLLHHWPQCWGKDRCAVRAPMLQHPLQTATCHPPSARRKKVKKNSALMRTWTWNRFAFVILCNRSLGILMTSNDI